jgi:cell filamentation protein
VTNLSEHVAAAKGLDGGAAGTDTVHGRNDDPAVQVQYEQQQLKRGDQRNGG